MKKKLIISIAFIIVFILFFNIKNNKEVLKKETAKTKKEVVKLEYKKPANIDKNNFLSNTNLNAFYTKQISWDTLTNNITLSKDKVTWWIRDEIKYLYENLFTNNVTYSVTNLFNILVKNSIPITLSITNSAYSTGLISLRYRQLLPYVKQIILQVNNSSNRDIASKYITWLGHIQHPDTLRTILELDKEIPQDSILRQKKPRIWDGALPFFYRKDCLDVYIEVANQPEKYDYGMWNSAVYNIGWFTNDCAIQAYNRAYKVMKHFKKYWPESPVSRSIDRVCMATQMKTRQRIIDGKQLPRKRPKPLLDE